MNKKTQKALLFMFISLSVLLVLQAIITKWPIMIVCAVIAVVATIAFVIAVIVNNKKEKH